MNASLCLCGSMNVTRDYVFSRTKNTLHPGTKWKKWKTRYLEPGILDRRPICFQFRNFAEIPRESGTIPQNHVIFSEKRNEKNMDLGFSTELCNQCTLEPFYVIRNFSCDEIQIPNFFKDTKQFAKWRKDRLRTDPFVVKYVLTIWNVTCFLVEKERTDNAHY